MRTYASILNCDLMNVKNEINKIRSYGVSGIHIDVMDGIFVKEFTYGWHFVKGIKNITSLPLEVHLMVQKPENYIDHYINIQPESIIIHPESTHFLRRTINKINNSRVNSGVALKLDSPINDIENVLDIVESVTIISCDEGFGGNEFREIAVNKIKKLFIYKQKYNLNFKINVDGGINYDIAKNLKALHVDSIVSGSYILNGGKNAVEQLLSI